MTRDEVASILEDVLPKSQHGKIERILHKMTFEEIVFDVFISDSRVTVETVEEYGLIIEVDASGRAGAVHFPNGAEVDA